jgi:hypothetical protein
MIQLVVLLALILAPASGAECMNIEQCKAETTRLISVFQSISLARVELWAAENTSVQGILQCKKRLDAFCDEAMRVHGLCTKGWCGQCDPDLTSGVAWGYTLCNPYPSRLPSEFNAIEEACMRGDRSFQAEQWQLLAFMQQQLKERTRVLGGSTTLTSGSSLTASGVRYCEPGRICMDSAAIVL